MNSQPEFGCYIERGRDWPDRITSRPSSGLRRPLETSGVVPAIDRIAVRGDGRRLQYV